ncbi:MAG: hypothetical protein C4584_01430 [Armatimonadetes bacterium]|nr:MAG: hypothetical protein C4584_01430 [Armatimonadota bacterium]
MAKRNKRREEEEVVETVRRTTKTTPPEEAGEEKIPKAKSTPRESTESVPGPTATEMARLKRQLAEALAHAEEAETETATATAKLTACAKARNGLRIQVDELEPQLEETERKLADATRENKKLTTANTQLTTDNRGLADLMAEAEETAKKLKSAEDELTRLRREHAEAVEANEQIISDMARLHEQLEENMKKFTGLTTRIRTLEIKNGELIEDGTNLERQNRALEDQGTDIVSQLYDATQENTRLREENRKLQMQLESRQGVIIPRRGEEGPKRVPKFLLSYSVHEDGVRLRWEDTERADHFEVRRQEVGALREDTLEAQVLRKAFLDTTAIYARTYIYRVLAMDQYNKVLAESEDTRITVLEEETSERDQQSYREQPSTEKPGRRLPSWMQSGRERHSK